MMTILSAEKMGKIPKQAIRQLVKRYANVNITEDGVSALAKMLEKKAISISKFAIKNAKKSGRSKITKEDINRYILSGE